MLVEYRAEKQRLRKYSVVQLYQIYYQICGDKPLD